MKNTYSIEYSRLTGMWWVRFNGYATEAKYTKEQATAKLEEMKQQAGE